jgi:hypothetical protein
MKPLRRDRRRSTAWWPRFLVPAPLRLSRHDRSDHPSRPRLRRPLHDRSLRKSRSCLSRRAKSSGDGRWRRSSPSSPSASSPPASPNLRHSSGLNAGYRHHDDGSLKSRGRAVPTGPRVLQPDLIHVAVHGPEVTQGGAESPYPHRVSEADTETGATRVFTEEVRPPWDPGTTDGGG